MLLVRCEWYSFLPPRLTFSFINYSNFISERETREKEISTYIGTWPPKNKTPLFCNESGFTWLIRDARKETTFMIQYKYK